MFSQLTDYGFKRTGLQALGFYIVYLILTILTAALLGMVFGMATGSGDFSLGQKMGMIVAILFAMVLSFLVLQSKKMLNNYMYVGLAVVAGILAYLGGGLLGLIIPAYLTTVGTSTKKKSKK